MTGVDVTRIDPFHRKLLVPWQRRSHGRKVHLLLFCQDETRPACHAWIKVARYWTGETGCRYARTGPVGRRFVCQRSVNGGLDVNAIRVANLALICLLCFGPLAKGQGRELPVSGTTATARPPTPPAGSRILKHLAHATAHADEKRHRVPADDQPGQPGGYAVLIGCGLGLFTAVVWLRQRIGSRRKRRPVDFPFAYGCHERSGRSSGRRRWYRQRPRRRHWLDRRRVR
jgi:hypothetical protein